MKEYERLFAMALHQKLKEKIVGRIYVKVTYDDELYIEIESYGGFVYKTAFSNFSEKVVNGWSTDYAVYKVVNKYRSFIFKKYFM